MKIKSLSLVTGVLFLTAFSTLVAEEPASQREAWNLEDCLVWGLVNHPALRQIDGEIRSAEARVDQTKANLRLRASLSSSFQRRRQESTRSLGRIGGGSDDLIDSTSESLRVQKTIWDFGQTQTQIDALRTSLAAVRAGRSWELVSVLSSIKRSFFNVHQTRMLVDVRRESLNRFQKHLERVRGFVEVGTKPPYDITKARGDVANARVELIKAERDFQNAVTRLAQAVGVEGTMTVAEPQPMKVIELPELDGETLLNEALARPDLLTARLRLKAARQQIRSARMGKQPVLSGSADYSWSGTVTPLERAWNVNLGVSVPILDGDLTRSRVNAAHGEAVSVEARLAQARLTLRSELAQGITGILEASQRLHATEILVQQASETLALAQGRYDAGFGSPIELTDAQVGFTNAMGSYVVAYFDTLIAQTELDRVLGRIPPELQTGTGDLFPPPGLVQMTPTETAAGDSP